LDIDSIRAGIERAAPVEPPRLATWAEVAARTQAVYEELQ